MIGIAVSFELDYKVLNHSVCRSEPTTDRLKLSIFSVLSIVCIFSHDSLFVSVQKPKFSSTGQLAVDANHAILVANIEIFNVKYEQPD
jgi:hypothetical protein